ncbi:hypothetical protein Sked_21970 [Sanguibacter keddieii DSM 10542]|uniref:Uncharacterized protein n=1 Tax=Sanguibacter keddieii (strain ATCC 51767 / DSM 10542 / NCFB 3025 / ST-74) TaxID=446469 RepID=D1BID9_SANKS|nr:hypothetical protein Sked_21970 [Sanguibacter keddieii DSM 10542]
MLVGDLVGAGATGLRLVSVAVLTACQAPCDGVESDVEEGAEQWRVSSRTLDNILMG